MRGFSNARFKGFRTHGEAEEFLHAGGGPVQALHSLSGVSKRQQRRQQQQGAAVWANFHEAAPFAIAAAQQYTALVSYAAGAQQPGLSQLIDPSASYRLVSHSPSPALSPLVKLV